MLTLVSTSALSLSISLEIKILASAILTHCNDLRTHCNLSSLVKHCSNINSFSVAVGWYKCGKTKLVSILHFFLGWTRNCWSSWALGCSRMQRHKGTNQAECYRDCVWLCLGMAKKHSEFFPWYTTTSIYFGLWLYQLGKIWIMRPEKGKMLPFCVR